MITSREISHLAIFTVAVTSVFAFHCPPDRDCSCQNYGGTFEIYCPLQNDSYFNVNIQPGQYIKLECSLNSPKWTDFHLNMESLEKDEVEAIQIRMCDLPPNDLSLGDIKRMLGAIGVEKLIFQSFKDLSLETLKKHHLDGFDNLKYLILSSNNISYLDNDLLTGVSDLKGLDLRENNVHLPTGFFDHTPELQWLELSDNNLRSIEPGTFDNLEKLTLLNLWKNDLTELQPGIFDKLLTLKILDINTNNMITLPEDIFAKLKNLDTINLSRNNFTELPKDLLRYNTKLQTFNMINNRGNMTTLPNGFFSNLTELKTLKLNWNGFVTLPEDLFWGSSSLANVSLVRNRLKSLRARIFRDSKQLTTLELSFNELEVLPDYIFSNTTRLIKLDLSKNRITSISRYVFSGLYALKELNMENNGLKIISDQSFSSLKRLKIAKFSNNYLTLKSNLLKYRDEYGANSPFHNCLELEELYLANNNITEIFSDWTLGSSELRKLDLKYNDISFISTVDLQFLSGKIVVDLTHNKIQHISLRDAEELASFQTTSRDVIILVENNPLACDCGVYDFLRYIEGRMHPYVQNYFHIKPGTLTCHSPSWLENINVTNLKSKSLTCLLKDTDLNVTCPEKCDCIFKPEDKSLIIDGSHKNLTSVPNDLKNLENTTRLELYFSGNMLTQMPNLKELGLQSAKKLDLSHNNISEIFLNGLSNTIQVLELHNNNISRIRPNVLEFLKNSTNLTRLTLYENPWECDCEARDFLKFIQIKFKVIPELLKMTCQGKNFSISEMREIDLCPDETELVIAISIIIAFTGILVGVFGFYYRYQKEIKIWLFAHQWCLWYVTEKELDKDKLYDAFISYSHKDQDFVVNELVPKLENGPKPFKLCLHYRDWLAGEWIPTQIARSVEESRRTIVVLSPNFLESVWGRMEFRAAHSQALSEGRARVILILYGDIGPTDNLDAELKSYISMNTYVKWDDPWFWDKLRYALPHPPKLAKNAAGRKIFENHQLYIQVNGDKKELIYPIGVTPETPSANTTPPADTLKTFICDEKSEETHKDLSEESCKLNCDNIAIIFQPEQLIKHNSIIDNTQCTTV